MFLLENGEIRDKYNVVGEKEVSNLDMARFIAEVIGKELKYELVDFHSSRPGHDLRYALNGDKMKSMGWTIPINFEDSLTKTIKWSLDNKKWINL
jgi:dTDP-glucose 4,6-dehydratase